MHDHPKAPATPVQLAAGRVQLWRIDTPLSATVVEGLRTHLSPDELARADKLTLPNQRERFIARRGLLRTILAQLLSIPPREVILTYGGAGKPMLCENSHPGRSVQFNFTHCRDLALLGVTLGQPIGVDIEAIDPKRDIRGIGQRFFHPREWAHLHALPEDQQPVTFFDYWASKEAVVKAQGGGIMSGLSDCLIRPSAIAPDVKTCDHFTEGAPDALPWSIRTLRLLDDHQQAYVAAVALPGYDWTLSPVILQAQPSLQ
jgi:4'-phosphopantetheinyl transferase